MIREFLTQVRRFKTIHAGRRSFKTEYAKRTLITTAVDPESEDEAYFFGAPTYRQAKKIAWEDLKKLSPKPMVKKYSDSELWIRYYNDAEVHVLGMDQPDRIEGKRWSGGILDEFAHMEKRVWDENVAAILADTGGWCWLIGVPQGKNHFYELSEYARTSGDPEWGDYSWKSADVMSKIEIEKWRGRLDPRTFRQEFEGTFESYEGRAYSYFSSDIHVHSQRFNSMLPILVCCDFNKDPCIWELGQDTRDHTHFFAEISMRQTTLWEMCAETKRRIIRLLGEQESRSKRIIFYGDYTSSTRRDVSATASSWQIIRDEFAGWNVRFKLQGNPRIIDRVNSVNSRLRSADGHIHFSVDPSCVELMKDFEMVDWDMLQKTKADAGDRTHASDGVGYFTWYEHPVRPLSKGLLE